jgi:hypothetical protein
MNRAFIAIAALLIAAGSASAQGILSTAKEKAKKAVDATNAHTEAEQHPEGQQQPKAGAPAASSSQNPAAGGQKTTVRPGGRLDVATRDTGGPPPTIMREEFEYSRGGRRDPFVSLLTTNELRPTISDLRLTSILFDMSGRRSVAILRDVATNAQYRVTNGSTLGRMRVAAIRITAVVFTIDEFGTTRQDSLVLRDSTKARVK